MRLAQFVRFLYVGALGATPVWGRSERPLPPVRPPELRAAQPPAPQPSSAPVLPPPGASASQAPPDPVPGTECRAELASRSIIVEPAVAPGPAENGCTIDNPVRLLRVAAGGAPNGAVLFPDKPIVACRFAGAFGGWVGNLVSPLLSGQLGTPLAAVRTGPGFECRTRNHVQGAKPSAHGIGLAVDVASFELADKRVLSIKPASEDADIQVPLNGVSALAALRTAACGWFTTVLGPGSDPYHSDHLHLDLQPHGSSDRYRICQ